MKILAESSTAQLPREFLLKSERLNSETKLMNQEIAIKHLKAPDLPSETWTVKGSDTRRITAAEMRRTAGYTWKDYKTNVQIAKELKITPILDKLLEYKRNWIQHVNRMPRNRLPRVMKHFCPTGRRNLGRHLKRLLDT